jgi:hypothetical protein
MPGRSGRAVFELVLGRHTLKVTEGAIEYAGSKIDPLSDISSTPSTTLQVEAWV